MKPDIPVDRICSKCGLKISNSLGSGRNLAFFCHCERPTPKRPATPRAPRGNPVAETLSLSVVEQLALWSKSMIFRFLKVIKKGQPHEH